MAVTNVYIDGFNFYYGVTRNSSYKWLNLRELCLRLLPGHNIQRIVYVTAPVKPVPWDKDVVKRQRAYLDALATLPADFVVIKGKYSQRVTGMRLVNPSNLAVLDGSHQLRTVHTSPDTHGPVDRHKVVNPDTLGAGKTEADFPWMKVVRHEEKGSDVSLGAHMVFDGCRGACDTAVLISNDADLKEPVRILRDELGIRVEQVVPTRHKAGKYPGRQSVYRGRVDHIYHEINDSLLAACQFQDPLATIDGRKIIKPLAW